MAHRRATPLALVLAIVSAAIACTAERAGDDTTAGGARTAAGSPVPAARPAAALERAALTTLRFLGGAVAFDSVPLADTVALHLAPEGGGTRVLRARAALRSPAAWTVSAAGQRHSFVPPPGMTDTTAKAGVHFNCREYLLASRVPALADRPHVGVMLTPGADASCLRAWNATFVFDTAGGSPRLVAAVYDQWEW